MPTKKYRVSPQTVLIKLDAITVPEWARKIPREYLEESVKARGVIAPIIVARIREGNEAKFILVDGAGRYELAKQQGVEEIPARIVDVQSEDEALLLAIELEQTREPWNVEYTLKVIQELLNRGYTKTKIAEMLKISRSVLYRYLWILEFPEYIREYFIAGKLPIKAAETIKQGIDKWGQDFITQFNYYVKVMDDPKAALETTLEYFRVEEKKKEEEEKKEEVEEVEKEKAVAEEEVETKSPETEEVEEVEIEEVEEEEEKPMTEEEFEEELERAKEIEEKIEEAKKEKPYIRLLLDAHRNILSAMSDVEHAAMLLTPHEDLKSNLEAAKLRLQSVAGTIEDVLKKLGIELP